MYYGSGTDFTLMSENTATYKLIQPFNDDARGGIARLALPRLLRYSYGCICISIRSRASFYRLSWVNDVMDPVLKKVTSNIQLVNQFVFN